MPNVVKSTKKSKVVAPSVAPVPPKKPRAKWTAELKEIFLFVLQEEAARGSYVQNGFKSCYWTAMLNEFNLRAHKSFDKAQLRGIFYQFKDAYAIVSKMRKLSGFGWNEELQLVLADPRVWDPYIKAHPEAEYYRENPLPNYDILAEIFEGTVATGKYSVSSTQGNGDNDNENDVVDGSMLMEFGGDEGSEVQSEDDNSDTSTVEENKYKHVVIAQPKKVDRDATNKATPVKYPRQRLTVAV